MASRQLQQNQPLVPKRKRLSYACNYCRQKKTRCDEQQPTCRACERAGVECITTDKRRPNADVVSRLKRVPAGQNDAESSPCMQSEISTVETVQLGLSPVVSDHQRPTFSVSGSDFGAPTSSMPHEHLLRMPSSQGQGEPSMVRQMTQWLEVAFARLNRPLQLLVALAEDHSVLVPVPGLAPDQVPLGSFLTYPGPELPPGDEVWDHLESFVSHVYAIYPFVNLRSVQSMLDRVRRNGGVALVSRDIPALAITYTICAFALMVGPGPLSVRSQEMVERYLQYTNVLVGELTGIRSVASVQAILSFCIVLRARDNLAWAWDLLTSGISMAQFLLLHEIPNYVVDETEESEGQRTWWCLYVFEKILAFDLCRRSRILDSTLGAIKTWAALPRKNTVYKESLVSLANILYEIQDRSFYSWGQKELAVLSPEDAAQTIIQTAGEIEIMLQNWQDRLPTEYQIGSITKYRSSSLPERAFFSFHYYQTKLILYRNSLLQDRNIPLQETDPWQSQIKNGPETCAETAIDMIRFLVVLADADSTTYASITSSPLLAAYVLVIYICNESRSLLARTDLELTKAALALSRQQYRRYAGHDRLGRITEILENCVLKCLAEAMLPESEEGTQAEDIPVEDIAVEALSRPICSSFFDELTTEWVTWDMADLTDWQGLQQQYFHDNT